MKLPARPDFSRLSWPRAARLVPLLAWGAALGASAWVATDLFWRFTTPRAPALPVATEAIPQRAAEAIASRHLLGTGALAGAPAEAAMPGRYALQAVVTGGAGRPGWAVIAVDGGPQQGIVEGQEIRPGVVLARVLGDSIELGVGGATQRVPLTERSPGTSAPPPPGLGAGQPSPEIPPVPQPASRMQTEVQAVDATQQPSQAGFIPNFQAQPLPSPTNQ